MNDKGEIKQFKTDEEAQAAGYGERLSREEYNELQAVSEEERKLELLWIRFWQNQKKLRKPSEKLPMRHAFLTGCKIMLAIAGNMAKKEEPT
jgi:hypothetical protein